MNEEMKIKMREAEIGDMPVVIAIIKETGFFRSVEVEVAAEVFRDAAGNQDPGSYLSYVAEIDGRVAGWICFGPTPCTMGTFDVYWIAVNPGDQRHRIGARLLGFAENEIIRRKGRLVVIETSGNEKYRPTQRFYEKNGYHLDAVVDDFYSVGDSKMIFTKHLFVPFTGRI